MLLYQRLMPSLEVENDSHVMKRPVFAPRYPANVITDGRELVRLEVAARGALLPEGDAHHDMAWGQFANAATARDPLDVRA